MSQYPPKGPADFLDLGEWNAACALCGRKRKASTLKQIPPGVQGAGLYACPDHWDFRQPQDYVRGIPDKMSAPWVQPETDTFIQFCTTVSAIADYAIAGCAVANNSINPEEGAV